MSYPLHINSQKIINHLNRVVFCLLLGILTFFFLTFVLFREKKVLHSNFKQTSPYLYQSSKENFYDEIGSGLFSGKKDFELLGFVDLEKELVFLGINSRLDAAAFESDVYILLKEGGEMVQLGKKKKLFLAFTKEGELKLQKNRTPLWIQLKEVQNKTITVLLGAELKKETNEVLFKDSQEVILKVRGKSPLTISPDFKELTEVLSSAKWWGPDQLFQVYGGETFEKFKGLERIECMVGRNRLNLHAKQGDLFYWKEGRFFKDNPQQHQSPLPAFFLRFVHFDTMEWEIWDETGIKKVVLSKKKERSQPLGLQLEKIFTRVRLRTTSSISCQLNNKALLLKKGDWLFKTSSGWRVLKSLKEIEEVINFQVEGELFVFDGVKKEHNISFFLGNFFDSSRTSIQKVNFSLTEQKSRTNSLHTKNATSSKLQSVSQTEEHLGASN